MSVTFHTKTVGPFFDYGARAIEDGTRELIADLIKEGEAKVEAQLYPGHGVATGEYKRSIHGKIVSSASGFIESAPGGRDAIIGKFLERGRYWPSTGHRFKGLFMFRKGAQHLNRLAKQMAGVAMKRVVKRLT